MMAGYFDKGVLERKVSNMKDCILEGCGQVLQNQMVENAHKIEGTLKNSINYKIGSGKWSGFSTQYGEGRPPETAQVTEPNRDTVRVGSALVYAGPQEKNNAWGSRAFDFTVSAGSYDIAISKCKAKF
jgi:hypothetical protein